MILVKRKSDGAKFVIKRIFVKDQAPEDQADVMNEIKVLSNLAHPNVTAYYGSFVEDGVLNVVMEFADYGSLFHLIQKSKQPFTEEQLVSFFAQLLLSMRHIHSKKILHRDLKTKNVFITRRLQIKLGDFGLSKVLGPATSFAQSAVGTPYYLSPELCEGRPYNRKSDVWALGCIMYEMATFRHAFDATNLPALVMSIVQGQYSPVSQMYSDELRDAIAACLVKRPEARADVEDLLNIPLIRAEAERLEGEYQKAAHAQINRPFFNTGVVETSISSGDVNMHRSSTDQILSEVEEEEEFERLISRFRQHLDIKDRIQNGVPFYKCFIGANLVDYLCQSLGIGTREEATAAAQRWMDAGVFYHVNRNAMFADGESFYRFKEDEAGSILNMKIMWTGPKRENKEILDDFARVLGQIYVRHTAAMDGTSFVDYESLAVSDALKEFLSVSNELQTLDPSALSFSEKMAFFLNVFNALIIQGFVALGPPTSLYQRVYFYNHTCLSIGNKLWSLNDIRDGILRGNQKPYMSYRRVLRRNDPRLACSLVVVDPRIHFALVRGTRGCPAHRLYNAETIEEQLHAAAVDYCTRNIQVKNSGSMDPSRPFASSRKQVALPAVFEWYREDFGNSDEQILKFVVRYLPQHVQRDLATAIQNDAYEIRYASFDWALNKKPAGFGGVPHGMMMPPRDGAGDAPGGRPIPAGAAAPGAPAGREAEPDQVEHERSVTRGGGHRKSNPDAFHTCG